MHYILFIDDERTLDMVDTSKWPTDENGRLLTVFTARSSAEAIACVEQSGLPVYMSLDHDLGGDDKTPIFLKWLANEYQGVVEGTSIAAVVVPPPYGVHSANPIGEANMRSYLDSWSRSLAL